MIKVGILGSVGSGKSFVANIFKELGFNIFSADQVVSQIYERNKNINKKISIFFKLKLNRGKINKNELRDTLKKNPKKFKYLNKIIHPIVRKKLILFLSKYKKTKLVVLDIPLLIENKMFNFVDIFIFVKTKPNIFKIRIKKRRNLDKQFLKLLENQQADEKIKKSYADFTVDNSTKDKVKLQVKKILDKILLND
ncbi:MAG: dephospho-CoA kinase [Candidatus Fonsibacter sp.]|jgi:dephospho-CoA kinase|nr:dephospho-CoA kinase [Candidatus Fonsibacter ubiquis]NDC18183.1 dephospho-CoA kinase [Pseudomonadota bacterium]NCU46095.1 dephospho-CoA kinase [Candidatus Fonsibacter ubiquis]NCU47990.1 dephospho-CoA kinase [Candidatus Fonsibacter ubiquis]NCU51472.1 dephospho-CoA kinase [Candidatus Fonsibacter ubiquis]